MHIFPHRGVTLNATLLQVLLKIDIGFRTLRKPKRKDHVNPTRIPSASTRIMARNSKKKTEKPTKKSGKKMTKTQPEPQWNSHKERHWVPPHIMERDCSAFDSSTNNHDIGVSKRYKFCHHRPKTAPAPAQPKLCAGCNVPLMPRGTSTGHVLCKEACSESNPNTFCRRCY
jgi:hypothetical protein